MFITNVQKMPQMRENSKQVQNSKQTKNTCTQLYRQSYHIFKAFSSRYFKSFFPLCLCYQTLLFQHSLYEGISCNKNYKIKNKPESFSNIFKTQCPLKVMEKPSPIACNVHKYKVSNYCAFMHTPETATIILTHILTESEPPRHMTKAAI